MTKLHLTSNGLFVNDQPIRLNETTVATLAAAIGSSPRVIKVKGNQIHTWDERGIYAHCARKRAVVHGISVLIAKDASSYPYMPGSAFAGTIRWEDELFTIANDEEAARYFTHVRKLAGPPKPRETGFVEMRLGSASIGHTLDDGRKRVMGLFLCVPKDEPPELPPIEPPTGEGVAFGCGSFRA